MVQLSWLGEASEILDYFGFQEAKELPAATPWYAFIKVPEDGLSELMGEIHQYLGIEAALMADIQQQYLESSHGVLVVGMWLTSQQAILIKLRYG
jgi:hypothetical protein